MREPSDAEQRLEQLLDRTLRALPARRAPASIETRVLGELQRRAALPWWRQSFARWPQAARAAFVVLCIALVAFESGALSMPLAQRALVMAGAAGQLALSLGRMAPPDWVYVGLAVSAVLYATLFGLGAAACALFLKSDTQGDLRP